MTQTQLIIQLVKYRNLIFRQWFFDQRIFFGEFGQVRCTFRNYLLLCSYMVLQCIFGIIWISVLQS